MAENKEKILYASIIIYIIVMITIIFIKPNFIYDNNEKKFKSFGFDNDKTIFTMPVLSLTICVAIYMILLIYAIVIKKLK